MQIWDDMRKLLAAPLEDSLDLNSILALTGLIVIALIFWAMIARSFRAIEV